MMTVLGESADSAEVKRTDLSESKDSKGRESEEFFVLHVNDEDQTFSFSDSTKFDSEIFLKSVNDSLSKIKDKTFKHNLKLFLCKAFHIPMNGMEPDLSDREFVDSLQDTTKALDIDPNAEIGKVNASDKSSGDSLEEDLESFEL